MRDPQGHLGSSAQGPGSHTATRGVAEHRAHSPPAWACARLVSTLWGWGGTHQILLYKEESHPVQAGEEPAAARTRLTPGAWGRA